MENVFSIYLFCSSGERAVLLGNETFYYISKVDDRKIKYDDGLLLCNNSRDEHG